MIERWRARSSWDKAGIWLLLVLVFLINGSARSRAETGVPGSVTVVEVHQGVPTFMLEGEPFTTPAYATYNIQERFFREMGDAGVRLYTFVVNIAGGTYRHTRPSWVAPDVWDYTDLDARAAAVLSGDPDAMLMPRFYISAPQWWLEKHPEEVMVLHDGATKYAVEEMGLVTGVQYPSLGSTKWREAMAVALRNVIDHIENSDYADRVFGYQLSGLATEEWYHWGRSSSQMNDYSLPMTLAFRDWLRQRYGSVEKLRESWADSTLEFDVVQIPTKQERLGNRRAMFRDPVREMNVIDFYSFYNEIIPDTIDYLAGVVKEATGGKKVVGAFYAFMFEFGGDPQFGHNALGRLVESENVDFVLVTASYHNRQLASGGDYVRSPAKTVSLHGKVWYHDNDVASFLYPIMITRGVPKEHLQWLGLTDSVQETIWMYRRVVGFVLANGFYTDYYDLHGGYYSYPKLLDEVKRINQVYEDSQEYDRSSNSEILVVADERSTMYASFRNAYMEASLRNTMQALTKIGAPFDVVLVDDVALIDPEQYKLVIFLNAYHLSDEQRQLIKDTLAKDERTILWSYATGLFRGSERSADLMAELVGMNTVDSGKQVLPEIELVPVDGELGKALALTGISAIDLYSGLGIPSSRIDLVYVDDPEAIVLGVLPSTKLATFAAKEQENWTSIYSIAPVLPPEIYREIARNAGVHIYAEEGDTLYANRSYLTLHGDGEGLRTIRLPQKHTVMDVFTGETLGENVEKITARLQAGETLVLRLVFAPDGK